MPPVRYEELQKKIPAVIYIFVVSPRGEWKFDFLSEQITELYEISPEEAYVDHHAMTACIHPDERQAHRESVAHAVNTLQPWVHVHRIQTRSGKTKWVHAQAIPEKQTDGSIKWHGVLIDVTWYVGTESFLFSLIADYQSNLKRRHMQIEHEEEFIEKLRLALLQGRHDLLKRDVKPLSGAPLETGTAEITSEEGCVALSRRELEVLECIARGKTSKAISTEMHIAPATVAAHRRNIKRKLRLRTTANVTRYAVLRFPQDQVD